MVAARGDGLPPGGVRSGKDPAEGQNDRDDARTGAERQSLILDEQQRKSADARRDAYHAADFAVLCLPDDAAREAVAMAEGST